MTDGDVMEKQKALEALEMVEHFIIKQSKERGLNGCLTLIRNHLQRSEVERNTETGVSDSV